jgi:hypothetical protein
VREQRAGIFADMSRLKPLWVQLSMLFARRSLISERIEPTLEEDAVQVGIPPNEVSRRGVGDNGSPLDPSSGGRAVDALHHAGDQAAEIADQAMIVAEEYSEHLGKSDDDLAVRQAEQELLVHVLPEEQRSFLRA